jgi:hypothetical protein
MPLLRTFSLYAKTAAQSVFPYSCGLVDFDGNLISGAAGSFLQFHDKATAASAGNVPIKSFYIPSAGPTPLASIFQLMGPITFKLGLSIGISSTEATYTAQTATFDIFGEIEEGYQLTDSIDGLTTLTNSSDSSISLFNAGSPKRLYSTTIANGEGIVVFPMLLQGPRVVNILDPIAIGATQSYYFGKDGYTFPDNTVAASVALSSTSPNYTDSGVLGSTFTAKLKA